MDFKLEKMLATLYLANVYFRHNWEWIKFHSSDEGK